MWSGARPEVDLAQGHEAAHQQAGAHEQGQGHRDLHDHDRVAQPPTAEAAARALAAVAQGLVEVAPGRLQGGDQAEDEGGQDRHRRG